VITFAQTGVRTRPTYSTARTSALRSTPVWATRSFQHFAAASWLADTDDNRLLDTRLVVAADVIEERYGPAGSGTSRRHPTEAGWWAGPGDRRGHGAGRVRRSPATGQVTAGQIVSALGVLLEERADQLRIRLAPAVRELIADGLLIVARRAHFAGGVGWVARVGALAGAVGWVARVGAFLPVGRGRPARSIVDRSALWSRKALTPRPKRHFWSTESAYLSTRAHFGCGAAPDRSWTEAHFGPAGRSRLAKRRRIGGPAFG